MKNIVIAGHFFAITAALEYFVRAARRREDLRVITIGPYHGTVIPWTAEGVRVKDEYAFVPDIGLPPYPIGVEIPVNYLESLLPADFKPDIWFEVNAGLNVVGRPRSGSKVRFLTDPHTLRQLYDHNPNDYDATFCSQRQYIAKDEIYLPYGFDSEWNRPLEVEKIYDAALIGVLYDHRVHLINRLREKYNVFYELGLAKNDMNLIYNQSHIGLNWSLLQDLNARIFEVMATGLILLTNRLAAMSELFVEGEDYIGFDNLEEALAKMDELMKDINSFKRIATNARNKMLTGRHSWDDRLETILKTIA